MLSALTLIAPADALALSRLFSNGAGDNDWFNPLNWQPAGDPADTDMLTVLGETPTATQNVVTSNGGSIGVNGAGGTDVTFANLSVGLFGAGSLFIHSGAHVTGSFTQVGVAEGADGLIGLTSFATVWDAGQLITVGSRGSGTMNIQGGAQVTSIAGVLADQLGGEATVYVQGSDSSWALSQRLEVGNRGSATLTIDGGTVSSAQGSLGVLGSASAGEVSVLGGGSWDVGTLSVGGEGTGTMRVGPDGTVTSVIGSVATTPGSNGVVTIDGAGAVWTNTCFCDLNIGSSAAAANAGTASVALSDGGFFRNDGDFGIRATGRVSIDDGTLDSAFGGVAVDGELAGKGVVNGNVVNRGVVSLHTPAGTLVVNGNYSQANDGVLDVEIGQQLGLLDVNGNASLSGDLRVNLADNYVPLSSATFTVLEADATILTAFGNVANGGRLYVSAGFGGSFLVNYGPDSPLGADRVVLSSYQAGVPGDYNNNGIVDAADYTVWRDHLGQSLQLPNADPSPSTPNFVDQEDYQFWRDHFGETAGSGSLSNGAVPEPASALFAVTALWMVISLRRRAAQRS